MPRDAGAGGGGKIQPFKKAVSEQRRGKSASTYICTTRKPQEHSLLERLDNFLRFRELKRACRKEASSLAG